MSFGHQIVTCADCGRTFTCLPHDDYYHRPETVERTSSNGVCESCLVTEAGLDPERTVDLRGR